MTFNSKVHALIKRLLDYWLDKPLTEKCEIAMSDICDHDWELGVDRKRKGAPFVRKCNKCNKGEILEYIE